MNTKIETVTVSAAEFGDLLIDETLLDLFEKIQERAGCVANCNDDEDVGANAMRVLMYLFDRVDFAKSGDCLNGCTGSVITEEGRTELQRPNNLS